MKLAKLQEEKPQIQTMVADETVTLTQLLTKDEILSAQALKYASVNQQIKLLTARMKNILRPEIEKAVASRGTEDISGHKHLSLPNGIDVIHERRNSVSFNEAAALDLLTKKKLLGAYSYEETITRRVVDEEKIIEAYDAGLISPKEFDTLFQENTTWALKITVDEDQNPEYASLVNLRKQVEHDKIEPMSFVESS